MYIKKIFILCLIIIIFSSCQKIQPEEKKESKNNSVITEVHTWDNFLWKDEKDLKEKFSTLSQRFNKYDSLIKSESYQKFVADVHLLFEKYKSEKNEWKADYLFTKLIPALVIDNFSTTGKIKDEAEIEWIIQSIKRKDFNTIREKDLLTEKFKIYFEENFFNNFIKNLEPRDNLTNDEFKKIFLSEKWVFVEVLKNRYDWNKTWIWYKDKQEPEFAKYLNWKIETIFSQYWYTPESIEKKVFEIYAYKSLEELAKDIEKDFFELVKKYNLEWKVPFDREYRNDEQDDIFENRDNVTKYLNDITWNKLKEFENDLKTFRTKMYLISYFWRNRKDLDEEQGLWSSKARSKFISKDVWNGVQNLFRISRYISWEKIKIDLNYKKALY